MHTLNHHITWVGGLKGRMGSWTRAPCQQNSYPCWDGCPCLSQDLEPGIDWLKGSVKGYTNNKKKNKPDPKVKTFVLQRTPFRKWKYNQSGRKFLATMYLMRDLYLGCMKNSRNWIVKTTKKDFKMGKGSEVSSPKKVNKWTISTWKEAQYHESLGESKSKLQGDTTSHLLGCPS